MTKDRELLELAAKAAGIAIVPCTCSDKRWPFKHNEPVSGRRGHWNPAVDDGDRYRLAKALGMNIEFDTCTVGAKMPNGNWMWIGWSGKGLKIIKGLHETDADAILALAAEIGRQMP